MRITITYRINSIYTKEKYVLAILSCSDDLLLTLDFIKESKLYIENSSLYKYNNKYIILFPLYLPIDKKIYCFKEFGKIKFVCENTVSHIKEYGNLICNNLMELLK